MTFIIIIIIIIIIILLLRLGRFCSGMKQPERLKRYTAFKNFESRILVATDLFGRGMDIERVNIVFNYDMPADSDQYLHRVRGK